MKWKCGCVECIFPVRVKVLMYAPPSPPGLPVAPPVSPSSPFFAYDLGVIFVALIFLCVLCLLVIFTVSICYQMIHKAFLHIMVALKFDSC